MGQYTSYYLYQKYERIGQQEPTPVYPPVFSADGEGTMPMSAKTENDPECGYVPPIVEQYRWVNLPIGTDYICDVCDGPIYAWNKAPASDYECNISTFTKYYKEYYQVSYDEGETWQNVEPEISRMSTDVIEYESADCGFSLKFSATYSNGKTRHVACNGDDRLTSGETRQVSAGMGYGTMTDAEIGDCVRSIGVSAFTNCGVLSSVTIPNSVMVIGEQSFRNCNSLSSITIPYGVMGINDYAFADCNGLTNIVIPDSVGVIANGAFYGCGGLTSITIPSGTSIMVGLREIALKTFQYCSNLKRINSSVDGFFNLPSGVTSIGSSAFESCSGMTSINIPSGVTSIGSSAFRNCGNLTSITIPDAVTTIGDRTFEGCKSLTSITIPSGVTNIGEYTFRTCPSLTSITILATTPPRSGYQFDYPINFPIYVPCESLQVYKSTSGWVGYKDNIYPIPPCNGYTYRTLTTATTCVGFDKYTVEEYQVSTDGGTTWKTLSTAVTTLVEPDSYDCGYLPGTKFKATYSGGQTYSAHCDSSSMTLSSGETKVSGYDYTEMTVAEIGDCVTDIGFQAFMDCSGLTHCSIGSGVTSIGTSAFLRCKSLTSCTLPSGVTSIGNSAFSHCSGLTNMVIPSGVTNISWFLFSDCTSLSSVTLPNNIKTIAYRAFIDCSSLTSITIPNSVTTIADYAFLGCSSLTSITCLRETPPTLGSSVFYNTNNCPIYVPSGSVNTYKNASGWSTYASRIQAIP